MSFDNEAIMGKKKLTTEQKIGNKIQTLRKSGGFTQEELADLIGISRSHMGYLEQGRRNASLKVLKKIARILKVSLASLFPD